LSEFQPEHARLGCRARRASGGRPRARARRRDGPPRSARRLHRARPWSRAGLSGRLIAGWRRRGRRLGRARRRGGPRAVLPRRTALVRKRGPGARDDPPDALPPNVDLAFPRQLARVPSWSLAGSSATSSRSGRERRGAGDRAHEGRPADRPEAARRRGRGCRPRRARATSSAPHNRAGMRRRFRARNRTGPERRCSSVSSGVGKSTLRQPVRRPAKQMADVGDPAPTTTRAGHTTSHRELILLPGGGCVIEHARPA